MTTETATEIEVATAPVAKKPAARKPAAKKIPAAKPVAKKAAAKKVAAKKAEKKGSILFSTAKLKESGEKIKESADKAQDLIKTVVYAQLGVYGKIYDEVSSRIETTRDEAPKQWNSLVKRGVKVQKDLGKSQKELTAKIKEIDLKDGVKKVTVGYKESLEKVKFFGKKAA